MVWGIHISSSLTQGSNQFTITYPKAFTTAACAVMLSSSHSRSILARISVSKANFVFILYANTAPSGSQNAGYLAIGY